MSGLEIETFHGYEIYPLVRDVVHKRQIPVHSCLDVGCGRNPSISWFQKLAGTESRYVGTETDPKIISELRGKGLDIVNPFSNDRDISSDLVLAREVAEHIKVSESKAFFDYCAKNARRVFALTTPNFEHWPGRRSSDPGLRFVPDHLYIYDPTSNDPHKHKQEMTPDKIASYMASSFGSDWSITVYRAWPWKLEDLARGSKWDIFFKVFVVAWR